MPRELNVALVVFQVGMVGMVVIHTVTETATVTVIEMEVVVIIIKVLQYGNSVQGKNMECLLEQNIKYALKIYHPELVGRT